MNDFSNNGHSSTQAPTRDDRLGRVLREQLKVPAEVRRLRKSIDSMVELLGGLEHHITGFERRQHQFEQTQRELLQSVRALYQKQQILEESSQRNVMLTEEHFARHVITPLGRQLADLLDLAESFVEEGGRDQREAIVAGAFDLLTIYGIEPVIVREHDRFDSAVMKPVMRIPTSNADLDHRVHSVVRRGYRYDNRILRPVSIRLYSLAPIAA